MRGERTVKFDFDFKYSADGAYSETSEVRLAAPGLGKRNVHFTIDAYILEAMANLEQKRDREKQRLVSEHKKNGLNVPDEDDEEEDAPVGFFRENPDVLLGLIQSGLGHEEYPKFANYVLNQLTESKLASAGADGHKLTDETWAAIEEAGGMEAVSKIIGTFCTFFMNEDAPPKKTGKGKSRSSSKRPAAA